MPLNRQKFFQALDLLREAMEDDAPTTEAALNKSRLAKSTGFGTRTIAELMRSGAVPTYDQGRKAKASDIQRAMQDRPVRMAGNSRTRQPFNRIQVYK